MPLIFLKNKKRMNIMHFGLNGINLRNKINSAEREKTETLDFNFI